MIIKLVQHICKDKYSVHLILISWIRPYLNEGELNSKLNTIFNGEVGNAYVSIY